MKSLQMNITILFMTCLLVVPIQAQAQAVLESLNEQLFSAVYRGDEGATRDALDRGADVNAIDNYFGDSSTTPLHHAAQVGNVGVARILLDAEANVEAVDERGLTPLFLISVIRIKRDLSNEGQEEITRMLLHAGASVQVTDSVISSGDTPSGDTPSGDTPLHLAVYSNDESLVRIFLEHFLENEMDIDIVNEIGETPLYIAVVRGYEKIARMFLDAGADVNHTVVYLNRQWSFSLLGMAIWRESANVVWLLLDYGAKVSELSPFDHAKMIELLRDNPRNNNNPRER